MLSYAQWDFIADGYIPVLALLCLWSLAKQFYTTSTTYRWRVLQLAVSVGFVYGIFWLDHQWGIWGSQGMDYSTHTALASVLVIDLCFANGRQRVLLVASLILYGVLMWYQQYHTVADMLTTLLVILTLSFSFRLVRCKPI